MIAALVLSLLLQGASGASDDRIKVDDRVETYRIHGATSHDLWNQMHALGPLDESEGRHFAGKTQWNVTWHYWYRSDGGSCRIDHSDVSLTTVTILPEWTDAASAPPALQSEWTTFADRLKTHEAGHRTNGMTAAVAVRKIIDEAAPTSDCADLSKGIDTAAHAALAQSNHADIVYDLTTGHGATHGAVLP